MNRKWTTWFVLTVFMWMTSLPVQAAMMSTQQMLQTQQTEMDREKIVQLLNREDVQQQLKAMGVAPQYVKNRVDVMTDSEVAQLNQHLSELPAGGSVIGVVAVVFLVFVITDAIGVTDIFPFVRPIR